VSTPRASQKEHARAPRRSSCSIEAAVSTTTVRLPQNLKARIAAAAERGRTTAHALIVEAIVQKAEEAERLGEFQELADERFATIAASGRSIRRNEMRTNLHERAAGKRQRRPAARKLAR
jgi:predicted transcriptional regulator